MLLRDLIKIEELALVGRLQTLIEAVSVIA